MKGIKFKLIVGTDNRTLPENAFNNFAKMINKDPLGHSFLIYNPIQVINKLNAW